MSIDPTTEQITKLLQDSTTNDGEVVMLNLLKFHEKAGDGGPGTGEDSYRRYAAVAMAKVIDHGGSVVWMGSPDSVIIGDDDDNDWDAVALVRYPNRAAFIAMTGDPDYQKSHVHREGGVARMALIAMTPGPGFGATAS